MKKYSSIETGIVMQSQLYFFEQTLNLESDNVECIGDLLPGVMLVNDMQTMQNVYMNTAGCDFLNKSKEDLSRLGAEYFTNEIFCKEEMQRITSYFNAFVQRNDVKEVTGFYQKVRPSKEKDWNYFYLSGKLLQADSARCIYLAIPANPSSYLLHKIQQSLETDSIPVSLFQRFSSLTKREKEILGLITKGFTANQISDQLFLSRYTIETHRKNIYKKLGTNKLIDLIRLADRFAL